MILGLENKEVLDFVVQETEWIDPLFKIRLEERFWEVEDGVSATFTAASGRRIGNATKGLPQMLHPVFRETQSTAAGLLLR